MLGLKILKICLPRSNSSHCGKKGGYLAPEKRKKTIYLGREEGSSTILT